MMPKIDFYILPENNADIRLQFACRLIETSYQQKHRIYVHTDNEKDAHAMDELLWTYRDESFLPHHLVGEGPDPAPPIQIGFGVIPDKQRDTLINLSTETPAFYKQFTRLLELITPENQETARERYRFYRAAGSEITTHKLATTELA